MKRVVRLTESDLNRIVKRVLNEQEDNNSVNDVVKNMTKSHLSKLGVRINKKTGDLGYSVKELSDMSNDQIDGIFASYAKKYIKDNPNQFVTSGKNSLVWKSDK
jgi:hypothetical protein